MVMRKQAWRPDTHDAYFEYEFDDADMEATTVCTLAVINGVNHPDPQAAYAQHLEENRRKNFAMKEIQDRAPSGWKKKVYDEDGDEVGEELKKKIGFSWHYDEATRDLTIKVRGASQGEVNALSPHINNRFGNRVKVEHDDG